jgi:perosamine synthetase
MPNLVFDKSLGITREIASQKFQKENIDARIFFWPISSLPMQAEEICQINKHSYDIASRSINLPSYHDITDEQLQRVIDTVMDIISYK